jgi:succinate dehydrogenase / fumarate reductase flavoprotein subunit
MEEGKLQLFIAKTVVLACGGAGQLFYTNTASSICTGDGNALALRFGIALQDMEFVQFHPTGLYPNGLLVTEAARAEGGILRNSEGEAFMERYAPHYKEMASRDVIARAIAKEIMAGRGAGKTKDHVWLDLRALGSDTIAARLPTVQEVCRTFAGIDPAASLIPIAPSAHYTMGGVPTRYDGKVIRHQDHTDHVIVGLIAIGETACMSVHGANRLGCNSLLDLIVFGHLAMETQCQALPPCRKISAAALDAAIARFDQQRFKKGEAQGEAIRTSLQRTMQHYIGVFRTAAHMQAGHNALDALTALIQEAGPGEHSLYWNQSLSEWIELENLILQAYAVTHAALARTESRGAHFRDDFPSRDDKHWLQHSLIRYDNTGWHHSTRPVCLTPLSKDVAAIAPEVRGY